MGDLEKSTKNDEAHSIGSVKVNLKKKCIKNLNKGKHYGDLGYHADHIIDGNNTLHESLSLFSTIIVHGTPCCILFQRTKQNQ